MSARILVVENDPLSRTMAEHVLRAGGHTVTSVSTAEEALRRARAALPDLILMDMRLPGMDGLEATRRLQSDPKTAGVPVAMLSGDAYGDDARRAEDAGCVDYMAKPIAARDLLDRVAAILGSSGKRGRLPRKGPA